MCTQIRGHILFTHFCAFIIINWNFNGTQLPLSYLPYILPKTPSSSLYLRVCCWLCHWGRCHKQINELLMHLLPISRIKEHNNNNKNNNTHEYRFDYSTHWLCDFHSLDFQVRFVLQSMKSIQKHFERTFMQLNSEGMYIYYIFSVYIN